MYKIVLSILHRKCVLVVESPDAYKPLTFDLNDSAFQNETERLFSWKLFPNKFSSKKTVYEQTRNKRSLFVVALLINSK